MCSVQWRDVASLDLFHDSGRRLWRVCVRRGALQLRAGAPAAAAATSAAPACLSWLSSLACCSSCCTLHATPPPPPLTRAPAQSLALSGNRSQQTQQTLHKKYRGERDRQTEAGGADRRTQKDPRPRAPGPRACAGRRQFGSDWRQLSPTKTRPSRCSPIYQCTWVSRVHFPPGLSKGVFNI